MVCLVYERLWLEFSGCYILVVIYFVVKKVKICMRWFMIEVDVFCIVLVIRIFLLVKYVKGFRKDRIRIFFFFCCVVCSIVVNYVIFRVWVVFL